MTKEEAIEQLQSHVLNGDWESAHSIGDDILCELLTSLGYQEVVDVYAKIGKWYA